ncbi:MAG TPA: ribbon-helix-helix domain-containing protein [Galbitalea sp.]|jgi:predicted transcriptional regulator
MAQEEIRGKPVSEDMIETWTAEAEAGYPVKDLRRRGRKTVGNGPSEVVPVRMDQALLEALTERAEREHVTRSEAIRAAVRDWISAA